MLVEDEQKDTKPFVHEEKPVSLPPGVKTEPIEEPLTLEGEPHALLPVKREIKEEAVPMTKAETTSAQPTTRGGAAGPAGPVLAGPLFGRIIYS